MAYAISPATLSLGDGLADEPSWLHGALRLRFVLPTGGDAIECVAHAREVVLDRDTPLERAQLAALDLEDVAPDARQRISSYVQERLEQA